MSEPDFNANIPCAPRTGRTAADKAQALWEEMQVVFTLVTDESEDNSFIRSDRVANAARAMAAGSWYGTDTKGDGPRGTGLRCYAFGDDTDGVAVVCERLDESLRVVSAGRYHYDLDSLFLMGR